MVPSPMKPMLATFDCFPCGCEECLTPLTWEPMISKAELPDQTNPQLDLATMPEIHVYAAEGRTLEQKRQLVRDITESVVRNFSCNPELVVVQIIEAPKTCKARGGVLFSEQTPAKP